MSRLTGEKKKSPWATIVTAVVGLTFGVGSAWAAVMFFLSHQGSLVPKEFTGEIAAPVAVAVPAATPAPAAPADKETSTPWIHRLFNANARRSVEDAGRIHLLFVTRPGTDSSMGLTSLLYVTREAPNETAAKLTTEIGPQMQTSFDEGLRYVRKQPRDWERDYSIRLSFEDKFTSKDGGSAGTGFTIAMLAATQGIDLDPEVAVTGDLTIDGTVQPVGAVVEKLRGAIEGKCHVTLIPDRNSRDAVDLALLDGTAPLWETQIFSISTVNEALSLARKDRAENIQNAITKFTALRARLPAVVTANYLQSPIVQAELKEVLRLAPNHLSAATLLRAANNELPRELSLNRSVDEIVSAAYFFVGNVIEPSVNQPAQTDKTGSVIFPEREYNKCIQSLQRLNSILDRRSLDLKTWCLTYTSLLRSAWMYQSPDANAWRTPQQFAQVAQRERVSLQQTKVDLGEARSRLLLSLRKLDTDGSLVSEMRHK